jgi:branched-chain amino acid transport system substrate-binding protein
MKRLALVTAALLLVPFVTVCSQLSQAAPASAVSGGGASLSPADERIGVTDTEVTIGNCAPLSGEIKAAGTEFVAGGRAYFSYINDQGGVNGRKLNLVSCDDKYTPEGAIDCFNSCLKGKAFLGAMFLGSAPSSKYVTMSDVTHTPLVGFHSSPEFLVHPVHPYVFQLRRTFKTEVAEQIRTLWDTLHMRKIAVVFQNDAYGAVIRESVSSALQRYNATAVVEISITRLTHDIDPVIKQLKDCAPDAVILAVAGKARNLIVQRHKEFGPNVQLVSPGVATSSIIETDAKAADGMLISQVYPLPTKDLPAGQLFLKVMQKYGGKVNVNSFHGFLIGTTVVEGLKRAGRDLTRTNFVKAMESIHNKDIGLGPDFKNGQIEAVTDLQPFKKR